MVMFSISQLKIMTAQHMLKEAGIESFVVNKMDSAHAGLFGDIELFVQKEDAIEAKLVLICLLYTSPSPRDATLSRMPSSA